MGAATWIGADTAILVIQALMILRFMAKIRASVGLLPATAMGLGAWLFAAPNGLMGVGVLPAEGLEHSLPRNWFWHLEASALPGGICPNDVLLAVVTFAVLLDFVAARRRYAPWFFTFMALFAVVMTLGLVSTVLAPMAVDVKNVLSAFRTADLVLIGAAAGYIAGRRVSWREWMLSFAWLLAGISALSILSMILLSSDYRATRYWTHAILQSQASQDVFMVLFALAIFGVLRGPKGFAALVLGLLPAVAGYKNAIGAVPLFLAIRAFSLFRIRWPRQVVVAGAVVAVFAMQAAVSVAMVVLSPRGDGSVGTRYVQVTSALYTMKQQGPAAFMFGIGWNQWYYTPMQSPFAEFGAYTPEEIENPYAKHSIQAAPMALFRSVGFTGLILWAAAAFVVILRAYRAMSAVWGTYLPVLVLLVIAGWFGAFPTLLPEMPLYSCLLLFGIAADQPKD